MKKTLIITLLLLTTTVSFSQYNKKDFYIGINMGTNGLGGQFGYVLHPRFNLRLSSSYLQAKYNDQLIESTNLIRKTDKLSNDWNIDLSSFSLGAITDIKPFINNDFLRISLGLFYTSFSANYTGNYSYSDADYGLNFDAGQLQLDFTTTPIKPYIGLLLGKPSVTKKINFSVELGTMFQATPIAHFTGKGMIGPTATQESRVQSNISNYNFYPILSFQLNYRFNSKTKIESTIPPIQ